MKFNDSLSHDGNITLATAKLAIPFRIERQIMENWCWAACTQFIVRAKTGKNFSQGKIVADVLNLPICQFQPINACNKKLSLEVPLFRTKRLNGNPIEQPLTPQQIVVEIDNGMPIACQMHIPDLGGHAVVISNYRFNNLNQLFLEVNDPGNGSQFLISYPAMVNNYLDRGGRWLRSYRTK